LVLVIHPLLAETMRLDAGSFRYLTKEDVRILTAVEMGMKNHEFVPEQLIESIAHLRRCGVYGRIQILMKHGLLCHEGRAANGFKLTYNGYDCLALRALTNRGLVSSVGTRIGVGKESDIHMCTDDKDTPLVVKFHRLGRISFRAVKSKRDYLQNRSHASWLYLARLAASKEFEYMKVLYEAGFPVPKPVDNNRHAVLMEYVEGSIPLYQLSAEVDVELIEKLLDVIFKILLRFAACGLVHGDFNEFNLLVDLANIQKVTVIDFPQIISMDHSEAKIQFERDVTCIEKFFGKRFRIQVDGPSFQEAYDMYLANKDGALNQIVKMEEGADDLLLNDGSSERVDEEEEEGSVASVKSHAEDEDAGSSEDSCSSEDGLVTPERNSKDCRDDIIQDPRYVLKMKKREEQRNAPKVSVVPQTRAGKSLAKPNKQKRGQHSAAVREARAWKAEGGW
jgi:RIO kinase 2